MGMSCLFTFSDYSTLQSKIQSISIGGSINFQYYFGDKNCDSICLSNHVQKGCKYGLKCKVASICTKSGNCLCTLQMSCNGKSIGGGATFSGNSGNSATFLGNSGNSAISAQYLGLSKHQNYINLKTWNRPSSAVCLPFRLFHLTVKNSRHI